jgi:hypothetical protein
MEFTRKKARMLLHWWSRSMWVVIVGLALPTYQGKEGYCVEIHYRV